MSVVFGVCLIIGAVIFVGIVWSMFAKKTFGRGITYTKDGKWNPYGIKDKS